MRLALFGGTFDPIHNAHLAVATAAAGRFHLDRVLFIPAAHPPHKSGGTHASYEDRVRMAELACAGNPCFVVSRLDQGPQPSYSIETIEKVRAGMAATDEIFFLIGADAFAEIQTWHRWRDVANSVRFLVVHRPGRTYQIPPEVSMDSLDTVDFPVSSTEIRRALARGERPDQVPKAVLDYIRIHDLYRREPM
jgi:nicotinate-nucleotide adenylyltransferase